MLQRLSGYLPFSRSRSRPGKGSSSAHGHRSSLDNGTRGHDDTEKGDSGAANADRSNGYGRQSSQAHGDDGAEIDSGHSRNVPSSSSSARSSAMDPRSLEIRRQEEKEFIRQNDTAESNTWYLMDVRWLQEWKDFVTRGEALPGPIDNSRLLDENMMPRPDLRPVDNYRGVNGAIWAYWHQRYGGGPVIHRRSLNLYDVDSSSESLPSGSPALPGAASNPAPSRGGEANSRRIGGSSSSQRRSTTPAETRSAARRQEEQRMEESPPPQQRASNSRMSASSSASQAATGSSTPPRGRPQERPQAASSSTRGRASGGALSRGASAPATRQMADDAEADTPRKEVKLCCDKCDGPHATNNCPHFKKAREKHADAWTEYGKGKKAGAGGIGDIQAPIVRSARVVPQPGDGSCLFHSLSYGLSDSTTASSLRREICGYIAKNPDLSVADTPLKDWIRYDSGGSVQSYAQRMQGNNWGGGIEMAALTQMKGVNVHVYERCKEGYKRISSFEHSPSAKTVSVLYQGRMHYDAIVV
eukprot:gnl/TRDRNA2_/TRDRNA2_56443_c0_seq1.p1 gnl/TRDRNA2_/TRDRNA2_56443_c0~~gnl/TRDRNA2_/TRDRNA2_56443_c0_seq1.p1  ORF type:complete len:528 (-),score=68.91 gnl/TRDRNA2_/TRDRNA2_56443_c0_seq1:114-1697(-)